MLRKRCQCVMLAVFFTHFQWATEFVSFFLLLLHTNTETKQYSLYILMYVYVTIKSHARFIIEIWLVWIGMNVFYEQHRSVLCPDSIIDWIYPMAYIFRQTISPLTQLSSSDKSSFFVLHYYGIIRTWYSTILLYNALNNDLLDDMSEKNDSNHDTTTNLTNH